MEDIVERWKNELHIDIAREFGDHKTFALYECLDTALQFYRPADIAGCPTVYADLQNLQWYWYHSPLRQEHVIALRRMPRQSRIVEVGCGTGTFVEEAAKQGHSALGIDTNTESIADGLRHNRPVDHTSLEELRATQPESFDVVCAFQVLEHISDPLPFLELCLRVLRPGGRLMIGVPNIDGYIRFENHVLDMPPHHMTRWSEESLMALAELLPMQAVHVQAEHIERKNVAYYINLLAKHHRNKGSLLWHKKLLPLYRTIMKCGLRRFVRGHSIYAEFVKQ